MGAAVSASAVRRWHSFALFAWYRAAQGRWYGCRENRGDSYVRIAKFSSTSPRNAGERLLEMEEKGIEWRETRWNEVDAGSRIGSLTGMQMQMRIAALGLRKWKDDGVRKGEMEQQGSRCWYRGVMVEVVLCCGWCGVVTVSE